MKTLFLLISIIILPIALKAQSFSATTSGIEGKINNTTIRVEFYTSDIVRIIKTPEGRNIDKSLSVIAEPQNVSIKTNIGNEKVVVASSKLNVNIDAKTGNITFETSKKSTLLKEKEWHFEPFDDAGKQSLSSFQSFELSDNEAIYGLGQLQNGKMSQRGTSVRLIQNNTEDVSPFFQSTKGYGIFWDNYSPTDFNDSDTETSFRSDVGESIDYYFMYGVNADGVVAQLRHLTGQVPMMAIWTYGFWQSKERYKSQDELLGVVQKYRELNVPLDGIIQDWQYWGNNYLWNAMDFKNQSFSNPQKMIDDVHSMNAHMIISIWSSFGPATMPYRELKAEGLLFDMATWPQSGLDVWPPDMNYPSGVKVYNPYNSKARDIYWKYLSKGIFSLGMDGWWMDSTEPDHFDWKDEDWTAQTGMGSFRKMRNAFPLLTVGGVAEHQLAENKEKRVFILTRSGFIGQQRYGANVWSGDVTTSWENFRHQIPAGLNFSLCGMPHWNTDIGGFFANQYNVKGPESASKNPMFQELFVRWMQFGVFCPMMRSHGTDVYREIYRFGQKGDIVYDAIEKAIRLRYSLIPYIYSTSWDVSKHQSTFMRALAMDFVSDKNTWDINNEFMFGKSILVAPIVTAQYTPEQIFKSNDANEGWNRDKKQDFSDLNIDFKENKTCNAYLPANTKWFDFWTNKQYNGGQKIDIQTTFDKIPLFVKAGSIIPFGPDVQYVKEKTWDDIEIRIYPGADAKFVFYEDEGDNYNYENGAYTEIEFSWNDKTQSLTIGSRNGSYNGMIQDRIFRVKNVSNGKIAEIKYTGKKNTIKL